MDPKIYPLQRSISLYFDANPREIFITACLLIPIIGIGFYPKLVTQIYDVKAVEVSALLESNLQSHPFSFGDATRIALRAWLRQRAACVSSAQRGSLNSDCTGGQPALCQ
jgi:hypothetical protein